MVIFNQLIHAVLHPSLHYECLFESIVTEIFLSQKLGVHKMGLKIEMEIQGSGCGPQEKACSFMT